MRNKFPDKHIEELYEDRTMFEREIHDHQTKVFSMTADDRAGAWVQRIPMDESRLAAAKTALESFDVLGCQERFDDFLARLRDERGWTVATLGSTNVGEPHRASASFRRRIAEDNRLDMELYEHARSLIG